jgi:hypothetical protein
LGDPGVKLRSDCAVRLLIALFIVIGCWSAAHAETPWPLKSPAELKALHGQGFTGFQVLTYRHSQTPNPSEKLHDVVLGIGTDIIFFDDGKVRRVIDFRLGRIYNVNQDRHYVNSPIAAEVIFRDFERANREGLAKELSSAKLEDKTTLGNAFWQDVELKVTTSDEAQPALDWREDRGETVILYKGEEVVRWHAMDETLPASVRDNLRHVLLWFFPMHPSLDARLAADGRAPRHLAVHWWTLNQEHVDDYQLIEAHWCETCAALDGDMQPVLRGGESFDRDFAPVMVAAAQGKFKALSSEDYLARVNAALGHDDVLQAHLWFIERGLQYGIRKCQPGESGNYCETTARLLSRAGGDADVITYTQSVNAQSFAIAALRDKAGANAYFIDLSAVDAIPPSAFAFKSESAEPLKSALPRMAAALAAMPMVPAVYRDIGKIYFASKLSTTTAWLVWEVGRALPGLSAEANMWQFVDSVEAQTRQRHPEFY